MKKLIENRCLWCHSTNKRTASILSVLFNNDVLCDGCRHGLSYRPITIKVGRLKVKSFYVYDDKFKQLLLQYKEEGDEALAPSFLYRIVSLLRWRYGGYSIVLAPSSSYHQEQRGFNHLEKLFQSVNLKTYDYFDKTLNIKQAHQDKQARQNIKNYLKIKPNQQRFSKIIIFDDVLTTGETIKSLYELANQHHKKVVLMTISYNKMWISANIKAII